MLARSLQQGISHRDRAGRAILVRYLAPADDVDAITEMLHEAHVPLVQAGMRFVASSQDAATTRRRMAKGETLVALDGALIVGVVTLLDAAEQHGSPYYDRPDVAGAMQLVVRPSHQRAGIGAFLMQLVEDRARELGAAEIAIDTAETAAHLVRLYEARGYRLVELAQWANVNYRSVVLGKVLRPAPSGLHSPRDPGDHARTMAKFSKDVLAIDPAALVETLTEKIKSVVWKGLGKKGAVLGVSGGIDSAVCAALCAKALGPKQVLGLLMPESDSASESLDYGRLVCEHLGMPFEVEDIAEPLKALRCYERRDNAVKTVFPEYDSTYKMKIILPQNLLESDRLNFFSLVIQKGDGPLKQARLPIKAYLEIVAATNMKQRTRRMLEYTHADRLNFAVVGTPNRLEYDQGFFVKQGDGIADFKPIAHLYKTQVYALAWHMGLPEVICRRPPTTDTYSIPQTQEEFYFCLPYDRMDLMLWAHNHKVPVGEVSEVMGLTTDQCERVFKDIEAKRRSTRYQQMHPVLLDRVAEISHEL